MPEVRWEVNGKLEGFLLSFPKKFLIFPFFRALEGFVPAGN